ncbi:MAG TPA: dihydrolipoamide acetyltransferase family protein [Solirubrobacteraceae bacterium]|nr:dihydrolipoamide acetyltransferase family protein [Solirubrobacteraceae bacterium]
MYRKRLQSVLVGGSVAIEIVMPRLSDSMEEGTITQWLVAAGDAVKPGDPLVEVETDKATVTYECECAGTILLLAAAEGASVAVGAVIAAVGEPGETIDSLQTGEAVRSRGTVEPVGVAAAPSPVGSTATGADGPATAGPQLGNRPGTRIKASPLARRIAGQLGVDLTAVFGTGPRGRVIRADVELHANRSRGNGAGAASAEENSSAKGSSTVQELSRLQQTIARRMAQSRSTVPDFELRREFDMSAVVALREQLRTLSDPAPSYNDFMVRACALALRDFPRVNGSYRDGAIETFDRINIGIAVAADDALVVPTIFDADRKSLVEIGQTSRELAAKVRDGSVTPAELSGGTFTVSNLGMFGLDSFSAVVNPPQAAILAIGSLKPRPIVAPDGVTIVARPTVQVSLACDHRILYGADGARFLARLNELLEAPVSLVL